MTFQGVSRILILLGVQYCVLVLTTFVRYVTLDLTIIGARGDANDGQTAMRSFVMATATPFLGNVMSNDDKDDAWVCVTIATDGKVDKYDHVRIN